MLNAIAHKKISRTRMINVELACLLPHGFFVAAPEPCMHFDLADLRLFIHIAESPA